MSYLFNYLPSIDNGSMCKFLIINHTEGVRDKGGTHDVGYRCSATVFNYQYMRPCLIGSVPSL